MPKGKFWTKGETERLTEQYPTASWVELLHILPRRSKLAIGSKARLLNVKRDMNKIYVYNPRNRIVMRSPMKMNEASMEDWIYLAAAIDFDGSLRFDENSKRYDIAVTNTSEDLMKYLFDVFGGTVSKFPPKKLSRKSIYYWRVNDRQYAFKILKLVVPYMKVKKHIVKVLLEPDISNTPWIGD